PDAGEIADAVSARVAEAADVDLVDDGASPPARVGVRRALGGLGFGDGHRTATMAGPTNQCKTRTKFAKFRTSCSLRANACRRRRAAGDDLRLEEELLGGHLSALDLAGQELDRRAPDSVDGLAHGREGRVGAAHEGRVVVADDGNVGGD